LNEEVPVLLSLDDLSPELLAEIRERLLMYTVFLYTGEQGTGHRFVGTASCINVRGVKYLLTAAHVWAALSGSRFAVAAEHEHKLVGLDKDLVVETVLSSGRNDEYGPDLALLKLPPNEEDLVPSTKSWHNWEKDVALVLGKDCSPVGLMYIVMGAPAELSTFGREADIIKGCAFAFSEAAWPERGDYDYVDLSIDPTVGPKSYGGVSGGGLWLAEFCRDEAAADWRWTGKVSLQGVAFFQKAEEKVIRCHGRQSVERIIGEASVSTSPTNGQIVLPRG
jgi:hypothetical protein